MCVDNNGIRHNCEKLVQGFQKFVAMAINPGANLDSLPILDNPDNFVVHAYATFILELSYVAINNPPQLNSSGITLLAQLQNNACSSLVCQFFCSAIYLLGSGQELLSQLDGIPSLRQQCYVCLS